MGSAYHTSISMQDLNAQDGNGDTGLHHWIRLKGNPESISMGVKFLVDKGADPNIRNHRGETPVHVAARTGGRLGGGPLQLLLRGGGDPNSENPRRRDTALYRLFAH